MTRRREPPIARRAFLRLSAAALAGAALACARGSEAARRPAAGRKVLLVYFSRAGENYFRGGRKLLAVGNTAVVAGFLREALACDVFEIRPVDAYSDRYDATVDRNRREQADNARPAIVDLPRSIAAYDTLVIGSPIWGTRVPRIMLTFAEHFDVAGKTVFPFTTHAMSGLGHAVGEYRAACRGAKIGAALAVQGEDAARSRPAVERWLRRIELVA